MEEFLYNYRYDRADLTTSKQLELISNLNCDIYDSLLEKIKNKKEELIQKKKERMKRPPRIRRSKDKGKGRRVPGSAYDTPPMGMGDASMMRDPKTGRRKRLSPRSRGGPSNDPYRSRIGDRGINSIEERIKELERLEKKVKSRNIKSDCIKAKLEVSKPTVTWLIIDHYYYLLAGHLLFMESVDNTLDRDYKPRKFRMSLFPQKPTEYANSDSEPESGPEFDSDSD
jgi:hypothetical protein